jgi:hypothetical protein
LVEKLLGALNKNGAILIIDNLIMDNEKKAENLVHHSEFGFGRTKQIYSTILACSKWTTTYSIAPPIKIDGSESSTNQIIIKIKHLK